MQANSTPTARQFGLDWLRIGAFGLLILYHIGMFFVPWGWHVKTADPMAWLEWPMMAVNPWRLSLLFLISGVVSRSLMAKLAAPGAFARSRSSRLLVPLAAGMIIFVAPQPWAELSDQGRYGGSFAHFWLNDYFEFGSSLGLVLPTWNHLWFVAYLWVYSMLLAGAALLPVAVRARLQWGFDRFFTGWRLFALPMLWIFLARVFLYPEYGETHALADDPYAHAIYGFAFFFGVGLARADAAWGAIVRHWRPAIIAGFLGCVLSLYLHATGGDAESLRLAKAAARALLAWGATMGLLGMARKHLDCDGPARRYLTEAIFPYYIVHQTIIVLVGYYMKGLALGPLAEFAIILPATILGCALTYELARRVNWIRPILGLKGQSKARKSQLAIV
jgi:glucans biosynthesis protein C